MPWIETDSLSFVARHEVDDTACAQRTLDMLEDVRLRLEERFRRVPGGVAVIVHPSPISLSAAHPYLPIARRVASSSGRRYLAGFATTDEIHVLSDAHLERRAAGEDSMRAMLRTAERLYTQLVVGANSKLLPPPWRPRRFNRYLRFTWLVEGAGQYFSGQVPLFRPAVASLLREGRKPRFPPARRDAVILGGTVFDLLERERGAPACERLVLHVRSAGAAAQLEAVFERPMREIETAWHEYLDNVRRPVSENL